MKHADRLKTVTERVQRFTYKWLIFLALAIVAYGAGLYFGIREQHKLEAQKILATMSTTKEVSSPDGSLGNPNSTAPQKSPTKPR